MNISELMQELAGLWPNVFSKADTVEAWTRQYRNVLKDFGGEPLRKAWNATMAEWDKAGPPKPADIRKHCRTPGGAKGEDDYRGYIPTPRDQLMHVSREKVQEELVEARYRAAFYRTNIRMPGSPEKAAKWQDRYDFIRHMLGVPAEPAERVLPPKRESTIRDARAVGAVLAKFQGAGAR